MGAGDSYKNGETENGRWVTIKTIAGIKVLKDTQNIHGSNLPTYSSTSNAYFKESASGEITQLRIYNELQPSRKDPVLDIDIVSTRDHFNKSTGEYMPKDVAHVHKFYLENGKWERSKEVELMTEELIKIWGNRILEANKKAKFYRDK